MPIVEAVILLVVLVLASNIISHYLTFIPVSLIQIGLGLVMALFWQIEIPLDTDWFLLLFIAPLLFNDGRRFPKRELWKLRGPIFANAIFLVFLTTLLGGFLIYLMVPKMPLTVGFAVAAILSPTDPVAVQSIAKRVHLPENILHLVSGESLINDASGLIAFKYAVAATVTGVFSLSQAAGDFFYISIVGLIVGAVLMLLIQFMRDVLRRQGINDVIFNTVLQIMTPFVIYFIAEDVFHASGVITAVTAGIISHTRNNHLIEDLPELHLVTEKTWDIIVYLLNGIVFVILGDELPTATSHIIKNAQFKTWQAVAYAFGAWVVLLVIRVVWIYIYQLVAQWRKKTEKASFRISLLAGLSGVRGAVTMAGVLSLPLVTASGAAFPRRSLALFISAGVIIISLVVAVITLPLVSPDDAQPLQTRASLSDMDADDLVDTDEDEDSDVPKAPRLTDDQSRIYIMRLAINAIEEHRRQENQRAAYDLILDYQFMIRRMEAKSKDDGAIQRVANDEVALRRVCLTGERQAIERLFEHHQISKTGYQLAMKRLARSQRRLNQADQASLTLIIHSWWLWLKHTVHRIIQLARHQRNPKVENERQLIDRESAKAAIKSLSKYLGREDVATAELDKQAIYHLVVFYRNRIERAKSDDSFSREAYATQVNKLRIVGLGAQRSGVQTLLEAGNITWQMAGRLRQYINYSENVLMMGEDEE
ncbi:sodium:proton antiporter [Secundilactobacillus paracollinoides]|uniref:cation:proton antiporter n=1 Tax=Secundilactobacillus paracollinoides TaxID=240427 RepID=UPI00081A5DDC|nr:sodium:proton antiporter [Secundilactobacillus paracollinoides]ANZ63265.1 sodium:proton antiporter [Secundilactobacillus paracollinoides]